MSIGDLHCMQFVTASQLDNANDKYALVEDIAKQAFHRIDAAMQKEGQ